MDIVASQAIRGRDDHPIKGGIAYLIAQVIQSWTTQACSAVAVVTKNVLLIPFPSLFLPIFSKDLIAVRWFVFVLVVGSKPERTSQCSLLFS